MTNVQKTSLDAYFNEILNSLNERQKHILDVFFSNPIMNFTNMELSIELEWSINRVTPRVYELRGKGKNNPYQTKPVLVESQIRPCRVTGRKAKAWILNPYRFSPYRARAEGLK